MNMSTPAKPTGEPWLASVGSWAVLVASFGLSASTWIALARVAGFTDTATIPMVGVTLALAWLMPVAVDGYVVVALVLWMAPVPAKVANFAKTNTYMAVAVGIAAQSAYHLLFTLSRTDELWRVILAAVVGALPPGVAGLAVHMRALLRRESGKLADPDPTASTAPAATPTNQRTTHAAAPAVTGDPVAPTRTPSTVDIRSADPAPLPAPAPTPATLAHRVTTPRPATTPTPTTAAPARPRPTRSSRPSIPTTPTPMLAPSTTDTPVTASDAAQLALPMVAPDVLAQASRIAAQYLADHGSPITPGRLAARLHVPSKVATEALAVLNLDPSHPNQPIATVNGSPAKDKLR